LKAGIDQCRAQIAVVVTALRLSQPLTLLGVEVYGVNITNVDAVNIVTEDFGENRRIATRRGPGGLAA
jgi:hypothetical protein